ncbi:MAG: hypothetical protein R8K53_05200 [Mariprofundaceae bacterium]
MPDSSNIDDILKSIDALLKEGEAEQRANDDANDDANGDSIADISAAAKAAVDFESAAADRDGKAVLSILPDDESGDENSAASDLADVDQTVLAAENAVADSTVNAVQTNDVQTNIPDASHQVKRIVLSADMQVEDTPELPLSAAPVESTEQAAFADSDAAEAATNAQIARITAEICSTLQQQLPEIIAPLVAQALRRHLSDADS